MPNYRKYVKVLFVTAIIMVLISSIAFAKKNEWKDKNFSFGTLKTVVIYYPTVNHNTVQDKFADKKITDILGEKLSDNNVKYITFAQLIKLVQDASGIDIIELHKKDATQAQKVFFEYAPSLHDGSLFINILAMGYSSQYMEGYSFPVTTYNTGYYSGNVGGYNYSGNITTPQTQYHHVPGRNVEVVNVGIEFTLLDAKTGNTIWYLQDVRDVPKPTVLNRTTTESLAKRIVGDCVKRYSELLKPSEK